MDITSEIRELNDAKLSLATAMKSTHAPWVYVGDMNLYHGGAAIKVDRDGMYADVVEASDLHSAIGQEGCALLDVGTVILSGGLNKRRHLRSALASFGWKASDLLQFDRTTRAAELARALWVYGMRDSDSTVIRYEGEEPDDDDKNCNGRSYMDVDDTVEGADGLVARFMEELD